MKHLTTKFNKFLNEAYIENPDYRLKVFFDELEKNIKYWFEEGTLGATGATLGNIVQSNLNDVDKNLTMEFEDEDFYYQVYFIISIKDMSEDELTDCYIKVKKYDIIDLSIIRTMGKYIPVDEINEDTILELLAELDDKSNSTFETPDTLSDEDSYLEDSDIH